MGRIILKALNRISIRSSSKQDGGVGMKKERLLKHARKLILVQYLVKGCLKNLGVPAEISCEIFSGKDTMTPQGSVLDRRRS